LNGMKRLARFVIFLLLAVTETKTRADIDALVAALREVAA